MRYLEVALITLIIWSCKGNNQTNSIITDDLLINEQVGKEKDDQIFSFEDFLSMIPEKELPIEVNNFKDYLIESQPKEEYSTFKLNKNKLNGHHVFYTKDSNINSILRAPKEKFTEKSLENIIMDPFQNEKFEEIFIPIFKVEVDNTFMIAYLTYIRGEVEEYFAAIEMNLYSLKGDKISNKPIKLLYIGGGDLGLVSINSSISKDRTITEIRQNIIYTYSTEEGDIEYYDDPKIEKQIKKSPLVELRKGM